MSAHALTGTPGGSRDQAPRPFRVKIASPLVQSQRGHAAARLMRFPAGDRHGASLPFGNTTRSRRKASIVDAPPP